MEETERHGDRHWIMSKRHVAAFWITGTV